MPTTIKIEAWEVDWTRRHLALLAIGGRWAVPRSGLIFAKRAADKLALATVMPFTSDLASMAKNGMDVSGDAKALIEHQQADYDCIAARARAAGYEVTSEVEAIK